MRISDWSSDVCSSDLLALPPALRKLGVIVGEALVIGFFALMAWAGMEVLTVLEGMSLVSLTWVPIQLTQSVIPIGAALFILCELVSLPGYWRMTAEIGRAHVRTPVTNAHHVCRHLLKKKNTQKY